MAANPQALLNLTAGDGKTVSTNPVVAAGLDEVVVAYTTTGSSTASIMRIGADNRAQDLAVPSAITSPLDVAFAGGGRYRLVAQDGFPGWCGSRASSQSVQASESPGIPRRSAMQARSSSMLSATSPLSLGRPRTGAVVIRSSRCRPMARDRLTDPVQLTNTPQHEHDQQVVIRGGTILHDLGYIVCS